MNLIEFLTELKDNLLRFDFDVDSNSESILLYLAFPNDFEILKFLEQTDDYTIQPTDKTFMKNDKMWVIYQVQINHLDKVELIANLIINLNKTYIEKESLFNEFNRKIYEQEQAFKLQLEEDKKRLEEIIANKFNTIKNSSESSKNLLETHIDQLPQNQSDFTSIKNIDNIDEIKDILDNNTI